MQSLGHRIIKNYLLFIRNSNLAGHYLHLFANFDTSILGMHYGERYLPGFLKRG